jgi:putative ABC transport system permease protein
LEAVPGVESLSLIGTGAALMGGSEQVWLPEWPDPDRQAVRSGYIEVGPRYFEALRTPLRQGREFDGHDSIGSRAVAIVNETLARRLWPAGSPIHARLVIGGRPHTVVGLVADVPLQDRTQAPRPYVYLPYWQNADSVDARYCVRVRGDTAAMLPVLIREVNGVDPDVPVTEAITLAFQLAQGKLRPVRMTATFLAYAAGLAVLLTTIGLYGALAFSVSRRTKEMGIRMAVGAPPAELLRMIVWEGMTVVLLGVVAGLGLSSGGTRLVRHLLYGSATGDAVFYAAAGSLVVAVGLFACSIPAMRAARVEPMVALRDE